MTDYTPTTEEVRSSFASNQFVQRGEFEFELLAEDEAGAEFDRWLAAHDAEVERAAAEKAFNYAVSIVGIDLDLVNHFKDSNPYRKAVVVRD